MNSLHVYMQQFMFAHQSSLDCVCVNLDLLATGFSMCLQGESLAVGSQDYNWVTTKSQLECGHEY